jgi:GxxExxY protein
MDSDQNELTALIISAAIEVHSMLGPGMLESTYKRCLTHELGRRGLNVRGEVPVNLVYKELEIERAFYIDLLVQDRIVVELKAVSNLCEQHKAQLLTYLRNGGYSLGLLLNFNEVLLRDGIKRVVNNRHK